METSKIIIRPFVPSLKDEITEGREPFALLTFGNVTIELDYTLMRYLDIDTESPNFVKTCSIAKRGFDEIIKEMHYVMDGKLPRYHRDTEEFKKLPFTHNPLHSLNKENVIYEK